MQPYFFPYLGYFQLLAAVNKFIVYDDVNYIKGGWINRNRVLSNKDIIYVNIVMKGASPNRKINDIEIDTHLIWKPKLLKKIQQSYSKAPYFQDFYPIFEASINHEATNLSAYLTHSIQQIAEYLGIDTEIVPSSSIYNNQMLSGQARILDICRQEKANCYINPIGGMELYDLADFKQQGIQLYFLQSEAVPYPQLSEAFIPYLSIIDVGMNCSKLMIGDLLKKFTYK